MNEAQRLEALWAGAFGDDYTERNRDAGEKRGVFWHELLTEVRPESVLEVGCGSGHNLRWVAMHGIPATGVDVNESALAGAARYGATYLASAGDLPFEDGQFDLTFTAGVLIHQPTETLPKVMAGLVRCASRYVLCLEYFHPWALEVSYRGQAGALFKRNYGALYTNLFPGLRCCRKGYLTQEDGFDNVTYWLFEKRP